VFAQVLFVVASLGVLTRTVVFAILALMFLGSSVPRFLGRVGGTESPRTRGTEVLILLALSIVTFIEALYPPAGFDATTYHLPFARAFADAGSLVYTDNLRFPVFPQLNEIVFSAGLLVADDVTAQLTQWLCFVITAAVIGGMVRASSRVLAIAIWCGLPLAVFVGSNAYIECGLTMAVALAFAAWTQWRSTQHSGWLLLIGVFAGMAAATKYPGLFFVLFFGIAILVHRRNVALFSLGVLLIAAPWYVRIAVATGNPLFPYMESIFGPNDWYLDAARSLHPGDTFDASTLHDWLVRNVYNLRVWIVALTPIAAIGAFRERRVRFVFFGALLYAIAFWKFESRYSIVCIPLFAICAAEALRRLPKPAIAILAILALVPDLWWESKTLKVLGKPPATAAERDAFLRKRIWPYDAFRFLEKCCHPERSRGTWVGGAHNTSLAAPPEPQVPRLTLGMTTVYVLFAENSAYYWKGRFLGDWFGPYRYDRVRVYLQQPGRLARVLRLFGAKYFIVRRVDPKLPFEVVYSDEKAVVYRL
jgi:hypothetical protein